MREEDRILVDGLIRKDDRITAEFLRDYRPLFITAVRLVYDDLKDEEFINDAIGEIYYYLVRNDAAKLKSFKGESSFGAWLKIVVIRLLKYKKKYGKLIDSVTSDIHSEKEIEQNAGIIEDTMSAFEAKEYLEYLFSKMSNERYVDVIRALVLEDKKPKDIAMFMDITVDNLYNVKKHALDALTKIAIEERDRYENK
ncbi:MAG: sigma-70 family RNA polymerase sigma factor [Lentimicrobiaceae bacterium]|nr:sigma-70 family RNA polymerase sigma factor [Lentimicrobiaceae bacterium]